MTRKNARTVVSLSALVLVATAGLLFAGPLDPPAGPVTSTYKTLTEVEPRTAINAANTPGDTDSLFKITQPGSYYLTGNITGVVGKHGIEIVASGVTLDLNGFELLGVAGMGAFDGVSITVHNRVNIAVENGSVRDWGGEGVDLGTFTTTNSRVDGVLASANTGTGILAAQNDCTVSNCSASFNTGDGITTGSACTITNCSVYINTGNGIRTSAGCTITNCSAYANNSIGITTGLGCSVADCSARSNGLDGIRCASQCVIRGNSCPSSGNGGDGAGIHATGSDNRIEGNNCTGADRGIDVDGAGNIIIKNTCSGNTTDWVIVANNVIGPIVDRRAPASAAVNGFTAPDSTGSTHPNANFSY